MTFLHNETRGQKIELIQSGNKSSYGPVGEVFSGHLKSYSLEDTTFNTSGISGELFKFTSKQKIHIQQSDKIQINGIDYVVKEVKFYKGISFETTKILLAKE